uniref:Fibronectin type-III domain-containing protein n=1 Tax=Macrostomum lignano TaxID=282301 RepID=A0A1I8G0Z7_9PLAT
FITTPDIATVGWRGKFSQIKEAPPLFYRVSLGNEPGMNDIAEAIVSLNKSAHTFYELKLQPGCRYFSTVTAVNENGLGTSVSSDGFLVDLKSPKPGVVYNRLSLTDARYSRELSELSCSWHGFFDEESFIQSYETCVATKRDGKDCDAFKWTDVKFRQSVSLQSSWRHGQVYFNRVRAIDAANRTSEAVTGPGIILDATPPLAVERLDLKPISIKNGNFEEAAQLLRNSSEAIISHSDLIQLWNANASIPYWDIQEGRAISVQVGASLAADGESTLMLFGRVSQTVATKPTCRYRLQLFASPLPVADPLSAMAGGLVTAPGLRRAFRLYDDDANTSKGGKMHWHRQVFYFTANAAESEISIQSLSHHTGLAIDLVSLDLIDTKAAASNLSTNPIHVDTVAARDSGYVHASWDLQDEESGISSVHWAVGTVRGGTQLLPFTYVGPASEATAEVRLVHGSSVHVSVLAKNGAGLVRLFHSQPSLIDLTPPVIEYVTDGNLTAD